MFRLFCYINDFISLAGGGGSSSGGGGGGGSSSSGGGGSGGSSTVSIFQFFMVVVATIIGAYLVNAACKPFFDEYVETTNKGTLKKAKVVSWIITIVFSTITSVSGIILGILTMPKDGTVGDAVGFGIVAIFMTIVLIGVAGSSMVKNSELKVEQIVRDREIAKIGEGDPLWQLDYIENGARNTFMLYQRNWSNLNVPPMRDYMTNRYFNHAKLMMEAFMATGRRNVVSDIHINSIDIIDYNHDATDSQKDTFTAAINLRAVDALNDDRINKRLYHNVVTTTEHYLFKSVKNQRAQDGINQLTADKSTRNGKIQAFAASNGAYYSLDWGRMLLPTSGTIFAKTALKTADVNNHVIGRLNNTGRAIADDIVYQIYTYSLMPYHETNKVYIVGQISVPKSYGNIIVLNRKAKGVVVNKQSLRKISMEWGDFNKQFNVYAISPEQVTSFELLTPTMMQTLVDAPFEINIEVIDNNIYYFARMRSTDDVDYQVMLGILQSAYRELRL